MEKIQVGFIGCGRISDLHALGYRNHPDAEIAAVSDKDPNTAEKKGNEWGARKIYADYRKMLDDPNIDAVEILTPQKLHEQMVIEAAAAGKHILVQKPMTIDLESADRMIQAAKDGGKIYKVIENYMYYPPIRFAKELLDAGEIGDPINMRVKFISGSSGGWDVPVESWAWRMEENIAGRGCRLLITAIIYGQLPGFLWAKSNGCAPGLIRIIISLTAHQRSCGNIKGGFNTASAIILTPTRCTCPLIITPTTNGLSLTVQRV